MQCHKHKNKGHELSIRVYYEDTDSGGIVHHPNYLKFLERGRLEALRAKGLNMTTLLDQYGLLLVVSHLEISYLRSARLDQLLKVSTQTESPRGASLTYHQTIQLDETVTEGQIDAPLLCRAKVRVACVDREFKPCRWPASLRGGLA